MDLFSSLQSASDTAEDFLCSQGSLIQFPNVEFDCDDTKLANYAGLLGKNLGPVGSGVASVGLGSLGGVKDLKDVVGNLEKATLSTVKNLTSIESIADIGTTVGAVTTGLDTLVSVGNSSVSGLLSSTTSDISAGADAILASGTSAVSTLTSTLKRGISDAQQASGVLAGVMDGSVTPGTAAIAVLEAVKLNPNCLSSMLDFTSDTKDYLGDLLNELSSLKDDLIETLKGLFSPFALPDSYNAFLRKLLDRMRQIVSDVKDFICAAAQRAADMVNGVINMGNATISGASAAISSGGLDGLSGLVQDNMPDFSV